jgi:hypothetical protein
MWEVSMGGSYKYFTVSSDKHPTWRARFLYLYPPGTGWPSYTPGHWVSYGAWVHAKKALTGESE